MPTETMLNCVRRSLDIAAARGVWIRCRHFTFIIDGKRIVSFGTNSGKTHPLNLLHPYKNRRMEPISELVGTHSEMKAIIKHGIENCRGLTLLNVRVNRKGHVAMSKPCTGCSDMIIKAGISDVWYTDDRGRVVRAETFFGVPDGQLKQQLFHQHAR